VIGGFVGTGDFAIHLDDGWAFPRVATF